MTGCVDVALKLFDKSIINLTVRLALRCWYTCTIMQIYISTRLKAGCMLPTNFPPAGFFQRTKNKCEVFHRKAKTSSFHTQHIFRYIDCQVKRKRNLNQLLQILIQAFDWSLSLYFYTGSIWQINAVDESNDSCMHVHELFKTQCSEEVNKGLFYLMESLALNDPNKMPLLCSRFVLPKLFNHQNSSYAAPRMRYQNAKWSKLRTSSWFHLTSLIRSINAKFSSLAFAQDRPRWCIFINYNLFVIYAGATFCNYVSLCYIILSYLDLH